MNITELVEKFRNREVKAKDIFDIREVNKDTAYQFIRRYHYLGDTKFFSVYCYALYIKNTNYLVGCATYSLVQGVHTLKGWFSIEDNSSREVLELSRLCMLPVLNGTNATSYLLGNSINMLKKYNVRAIITLADASRHIGSIYQVCNFTYYGLCGKRCDFYWEEAPECPYRDKSNKIKDLYGVWIPKTRKHRYAFILDPTLRCNYEVQSRPTNKSALIKYECCNDTFVVYDSRYNRYYTCPKCTSKMVRLSREEYDSVLSKHNKISQEELKNYVESLILKHRRENKETYEEELF